MTAISQPSPKLLFFKISMKIILLKLLHISQEPTSFTILHGATIRLTWKKNKITLFILAFLMRGNLKSVEIEDNTGSLCRCIIITKAIELLAATIPDSKIHGANMGPIWGRQDPGGPHVGPMNFAIWDEDCYMIIIKWSHELHMFCQNLRCWETSRDIVSHFE